MFASMKSKTQKFQKGERMKNLSFTKIFLFVVVSLLVTTLPLAAADISGVWKHGPSGENWTFTPNNEGTYRAVEKGFGNARGTAVLIGNRLVIIYATLDKAVTGFYDLALSENGQVAEGQYRDSRPASGPARLIRVDLRGSGDVDKNYVNNMTWEISVYPSNAFSGYWVFLADRRVEGVDPSGRVVWTGIWRHLGQNRYSYEFDYQGSHNVEYVEFVGQGRSVELRGYSDPSFGNQHRVGHIAPASLQRGKRPSVSTANEIKRDGRFIAYSDGTVLDTKTNLMWAANDNGSNINLQSVKSYCANYRGGGYTDWRMPTQDELSGLYDNAKTYKSECGYDVHLTELIHLTCCCPLASDISGSDVAYFFFTPGTRRWTSQSDSSNARALPVRYAR
jgi:hypothetical protein